MRKLCRYSSIARSRLAHRLPRGLNVPIPSELIRDPAQTLSPDTRPSRVQARRVNVTLRTGTKYMVCQYFPEPMRALTPHAARRRPPKIRALVRDGTQPASRRATAAAVSSDAAPPGQYLSRSDRST